MYRKAQLDRDLRSRCSYGFENNERVAAGGGFGGEVLSVTEVRARAGKAQEAGRRRG